MVNVRRTELECSNCKMKFEQRSEHKRNLYQNGVQNHNDKQKIRKKKSPHSAGFWLEEFDLLVETIAFEKWFFQHKPETNDKICNVKKHIFCDNFQNYDYLLFNMNTMHLGIIKISFLPTDALYISLRKH
jgi:hypothetical protein